MKDLYVIIIGLVLATVFCIIYYIYNSLTNQMPIVNIIITIIISAITAYTVTKITLKTEKEKNLTDIDVIPEEPVLDKNNSFAYQTYTALFALIDNMCKNHETILKNYKKVKTTKEIYNQNDSMENFLAFRNAVIDYYVLMRNILETGSFTIAKNIPELTFIVKNSLDIYKVYFDFMLELTRKINSELGYLSDEKLNKVNFFDYTLVITPFSNEDFDLLNEFMNILEEHLKIEK